jgi:hypothetical protein
MKLASNLFLELMAVAAVQNRVRRKKIRRFYMTIKRVWHGWTTLEDADKYQNLLHNEIFPGIEAKKIPGYQSIDLFRREIGDEVEFVTTMTFDSLQNVIDFQGEDYEKCYVPDAAQVVLKRWDQVSAHYEAIEFKNYMK